jgi:hypothetical protein
VVVVRVVVMVVVWAGGVVTVRVVVMVRVVTTGVVLGGWRVGGLGVVGREVGGGVVG